MVSLSRGGTLIQNLFLDFCLGQLSIHTWDIVGPNCDVIKYYDHKMRFKPLNIRIATHHFYITVSELI